jgi:hypothetical protein
MKKQFLTLTFVLFSIFSFAQNPTKQSSIIQQKSENAIYQLFPTQNIWTFIKLDTRNGKMWQVHFSVSDENKGELVLNSLPLVSEENETKGRFTLYPTENMYNFLLLDQINGTVVQVQWSLDAKKRCIVEVIKSID